MKIEKIKTQKIGNIMEHRIRALSFLTLLFSVSLCLCGQLSAQTPATTTVADTVYRSDGSVASGTVVIKWPAFVTGDGRSVFGGTKTIPLTNGALAVALAPNSGGSPSGTSYNVRYFQSGGVFFEETWVVPTSSPLGSPAAPNVTTVGAPGSTTYYYWVTATNASGETLLSPSGIIATSNSTLNTTNYNQVSWAAVSGATGYKVYRSNSASAPSGTGNHLVGTTAGLALNDQSNTLITATVPALNSTDPRTLSDVRVLAAPSPAVTLAAAQVQGSAIVSNPTSTQTITAPSGSGIPLQIKGRSNNSSNVFEVYDNQATPVLRSWFDLNGAFKTSQAPTFSTVTSGSLLFGGSSGLLSQDNTKLFWDDTAKRLLVGPRTGFDTLIQDGYIQYAQNSFGLLNGLTASIATPLQVALQDNTTNTGYGVFAAAESSHTSGSRSQMIGVEGDVYHTGAGGTLSQLEAVGGSAKVTAGTVNQAAALAGNVEVAGGAVTDMVAVWAAAGALSGGSATNNYGILVDNQAGVATNNWAIKTGTGKVQFGDTLYAKAISEVRYADQYTGSAGSKIAAAIADLPTTGGTVDARGLQGAQTIVSNPFLGVTKPVQLILGAATFTVSVNVTAPSNVTLEMSQGTILSVNSGSTLTIAGQILAPLTQLFAGAGTVTIVSSSMREMYPQWWGAVGDDATDSTAALQACISAAESARVMCFVPGGVYRFSGSGLTIGGSVTLAGSGALGQGHPILRYTGTGTALTIGNDVSPLFAVNLRNVSVQAANGTAASRGIHLRSVSGAVMDHVSVSGIGTGKFAASWVLSGTSSKTSIVNFIRPIVSNTSGTTGSTAFVFENASHIVIEGGDIFAMDVVYDLRSVSHLSVSGVWHEQFNYGLLFSNALANTVTADSVVFSNNDFVTNQVEASYTAQKIVQATGEAGEIMRLDGLTLAGNRMFLSSPGVTYPLRFDVAAANGTNSPRVRAALRDNYVNLAVTAVSTADSSGVRLHFDSNTVLGAGGTFSSIPPLAAGNGIYTVARALDASSNLLAYTDQSGSMYAQQLGIATTNPGQKLEVNGGARLNTTDARPSCSSTTRGTFWFTQNGAGVKDDVAVCAKDAANAYAWRTIY